MERSLQRHVEHKLQRDCMVLFFLLIEQVKLESHGGVY